MRGRVVLAVGALAAAAAMTGCDSAHELGSDAPPSTLVVSTAYTPTTGSTGDRQTALSAGISALRTATGTPWVGRQDDVTGYLAELSGGSYTPPGGAADAATVISGFMDSYGPDLFGIDSASIKLGPASPPLSTTSGTVIRADQTLDGVPVLDANLIYTVGSASTAPRLNAVRGRVFPGLQVATTPTISSDKARSIAVDLSHGSVHGPPSLVVVPDGAGRLAWQLTVVGIVSSQGDSGGLAEGVYFIDATTGELISLRRADADVSTLVPAGWDRIRGKHVRVTPIRAAPQAAPGQAVKVSGTGPLGQSLSAVGTTVGQGTLLEDTTLPWYDPASDTGGIETYTMGGSADETKLPGNPVVVPGGVKVDPDALAAQSYSADILDYYAALGRTSYDDKGTTLVSSVHFNDDTFCNAFFTQALKQMVYGNPCSGPHGNAQMVSLDVAAHEVTHGVTGSSARLIYHGQSGAMNESFSDYFGNVISNKVTGEDNSTIGEDLCSKVTGPQTLCDPVDSSGTLALRQMLNGNTVDNYVKLLEPGPRLSTLGAVDQDNGGVHVNSSIWNNALWSIRSQLAQIDAMSGNDSPLAQDFDKIVYYTLTTQLAPNAGFVDGRSAIEQTIKDAGADPVILRIADQVFDQNLICDGCPKDNSSPGTGVDTNPTTQLDPAVHGDQVAWIDVGTEGLSGTAMTQALGSTPAPVSDGDLQVVFDGDSLVTLDGDGQISRTADGATTVVDKVDPNEAIARGLAGSDQGAAWYSLAADAVHYIDAKGKTSTVSLGSLPKPVLSLATGGGTVAMGTADGKVLTWKPGSQLKQVGSMPGTILSIATYGANVIAIDDQQNVEVFTPSGSVPISTFGYPFGAAMSADYAVWPQAVASLDGANAPDTDLYAISLKTGKMYDIVNSSGQSGFPALSGAQLVWQDAVNGGDDIYTAQLPAGL